MIDPEKLVIVDGTGTRYDEALALSQRVGAPLSDVPGEGLTLLLDSDRLSLIGYGMRYQGDVSQMLYRITGGRVHHEMLAKAAKTKTAHPVAIDAAAGMGEDAMLLAAAGYEVYLFEQNPVIAALLRDALRRAKAHPVLGELVGRMHFTEGDSIALMPRLSVQPELVYLDPMFPPRRKSGLIHKKLQLIQKLEQPCSAEEELLAAAMALHPKKIIVKRPLNGACLAGRKPSYTVKGKAIRYDCIVL